jgi:hypothetical protein
MMNWPQSGKSEPSHPMVNHNLTRLAGMSNLAALTPLSWGIEVDFI